jgi:hypothetical protein
VASGSPRRGKFARLALETTEPTAVWHGFISGLVSALFGITGLGLVLAVRYPQLFGFGELRALRSVAYLQVFIHVTLVASFLLGTLSAWLRTNKTLALVGITFTLAASLFGGSQVAVAHNDGRPAWLGVDFFVLICCSTPACSSRSSDCAGFDPTNPCSGGSGRSISSTSFSIRC